MVWYNTLVTHHFAYFTYSTQNLNYSEYGAHQYCTTYWHINNTQDIGHLLQLVFFKFLTNLMGSIEFGTSQLNIQDVLEGEWCGLKGSIFYSLYDFHSKTFLILIDLFCIIGILLVDLFFRLLDFGVLEKDLAGIEYDLCWACAACCQDTASSLIFLRLVQRAQLWPSRAYNSERATCMRSCDDVFRDQFIFTTVLARILNIF